MMIRRRTKRQNGLRLWVYIVILLAIVALVVWKGLPTRAVTAGQKAEDVVILVE